jgi:hypothetical protein
VKYLTYGDCNGAWTNNPHPQAIQDRKPFSGIAAEGAANTTIIIALDPGIGLGSVILGFLSERITLINTYLSCTLFFAFALGYFLLKGNSFYENHRIKEQS